jgi:hypothetical protein
VLAVLAATSDGVLKMPAPMTIPTVIATTSYACSVASEATCPAAVRDPPVGGFINSWPLRRLMVDLASDVHSA